MCVFSTHLRNIVIIILKFQWLITFASSADLGSPWMDTTQDTCWSRGKSDVCGYLSRCVPFLAVDYVSTCSSLSLFSFFLSHVRTHSQQTCSTLLPPLTTERSSFGRRNSCSRSALHSHDQAVQKSN